MGYDKNWSEERKEEYRSQRKEKYKTDLEYRMTERKRVREFYQSLDTDTKKIFISDRSKYTPVVELTRDEFLERKFKRQWAKAVAGRKRDMENIWEIWKFHKDRPKNVLIYPIWFDTWKDVQKSEKYTMILLGCGRRCHCCGNETLPTLWVLTPKRDPLWIVPHFREAYQKVLDEGCEKYMIWCPKCHWIFRRIALLYLFSPLSLNKVYDMNLDYVEPEERTIPTSGIKFIDDLVVKVYTVDGEDDLCNRRFKSIRTGMYDDTGKWVRLHILSYDETHPWDNSNLSRETDQICVQECAAFYQYLYPEANIGGWSSWPQMNVECHLISNECKYFLRDHPPEGQPVSIRPINPSETQEFVDSILEIQRLEREKIEYEASKPEPDVYYDPSDPYNQEFLYK